MLVISGIIIVLSASIPFHERPWIISAFLGTSLGFVLPGVTLLGQQQAGYSQVGAVTALIQLTRIMGGALGVALVGKMVFLIYDLRKASGVCPEKTNALNALYNDKLLTHVQSHNMVYSIHMALLPIIALSGIAAYLCLKVNCKSFKLD